ncbi:MAG TPA: hypothetical protein VE861_06300 [Gemmatimonadaceae bacterium]|nr:hypothetical protein [Gemmatimonadaceae bacterium]
MLKSFARSLSAFAGVTGLASIASAQALPPVRPLGPVVRVSETDVLGSVAAVRPLPGGRVLVNDITRRQLLLLDSAFAREAVIADTTAATANAYGGRISGMIPYRGDSTLFIEPVSLSMLVLDGNGKIARVMAVPRPNDAQFMVGGPFGTPGFDSNGRIVYRGFTRPTMPPPPAPGAASSAPRIPEMPDSAPILRVALDTRKLDTASFFKIPKTRATATQNANGGMSVSMMANPMPVVDDWTLLPDGTLAVVRGADYHIDWIAPDGARSSTPKIPFEWQRLSDEAKTAFVDSTKKAMEAARAAGGGNATVFTGGPGGPAGGPPGGAMTMRIEMGGPPPGGGGPAGTPMNITAPAITMVPITDLPDYRPAFGTGATRADLDGNLWIRTSKVANGGPVYDVINRSGVLVDRVALPYGRVIAGFGAGVVYMGVRDDKGARLELARMR